MENVIITSEEYLELLTIKNNASLLAITMNDEYKNIVQNLCIEFDSKTISRIDDKIAKLEKNENRH